VIVSATPFPPRERLHVESELMPFEVVIDSVFEQATLGLLE
jgi:hypothetical protein